MTYTQSQREEAPEGWNGGRRGRGSCRTGAWRPLEIAAMVLGFMVFWPIGLAILGFKIWQRSTGYQGDMATAMRQGWSYAESRGCSFGQSWRRGNGGAAPFRGFGFAGGRATGNSAFDDWRSAELARLEEEHRKLEAAEREFADYIENLRRAKD
ncbi:MAG: hypothetical protein JWL62_1809, partial [Hyphomicrobiales bacterium]|nr:hypothetical protein [Hyphomicrobiales bacterium]